MSKMCAFKMLNEISLTITNTIYLKEDLAQKPLEISTQVYSSQSIVSLGFLAQLQLMCISLIF